MKSQLVCLVLILLLIPFIEARKPTIVYVTGYWRSLNEPSSSQQVEQVFLTLLKSPHSLIIFGDYATQALVMLYRTSNRVNFIRKEADELQNSWHLPLLRANIKASGFNKRKEGYLQQVPIMYNKLALMREALTYEQFGAAFLYWVDPVSILANGLGNQDNYLTMVSQFLMASQPAFVMRTKLSPTAFLRPQQRSLAAPFLEGLPNKTADCTYFGGRVQAIPTYSNIYQNFLQDLLKKGWAGDEEDTMMLMRNKYPFLFPLVHNITHFDIYQRILIQKEIYLEMAEVRYFQLRDELYLNPNSTYYHYQYNIPIHESDKQKQPLTFIQPYCSSSFDESIQTRIFELIKAFIFLLIVLSAYVSFVTVASSHLK